MSELGAAVTALRRALADGTDYADAFNAVIDAGVPSSFGEQSRAVRALLADLRGAKPTIIGELAVASGALVEAGALATESLDVLLDALADGAAMLASASLPLENADLDDGSAPPGLSPQEREWIAAFRRVVVGTMARLARSVDARGSARAHPRLGGANPCALEAPARVARLLHRRDPPHARRRAVAACRRG